VTPTPNGGAGQILTNADRRDKSGKWIPGIYKYDFSSQQTSLVLDNYYVEGISPDGSKMLIFQENKAIDNHNAIGNLSIAGIDGTNPVLLCNVFVHSNIDTSLSAFWFANARSIAFRAMDNNHKIQLFVIKPDGTGLGQLTQSTIGVDSFLPILANGGIYWDENSGSMDYGWNWASLDGTRVNNSHWVALAVSPNGGSMISLKNISTGTIIEISRTDGQSDIPVNIKTLIDIPANTPNLKINNFLWFPNSQLILVQYKLCSSSCGANQHLILTANGELQGQVTLDSMFMNGGAWSPDKKLYGFEAAESGTNGTNSVLKVLDSSTMQVQKLNLNYENVPSYYNFYWIP
jgi:Tol biopolymer transport system component